MKKFLILLTVALTALTTSAADVVTVLDSLKTNLAPDKRVAVWKVNATVNNGVAIVDGEVDNQNLKNAISAELEKNGIQYQNNVKVLPDDMEEGKKWALVQLAIATLRCEPKHSGETDTQGIMGMPLRVIAKAGEWYRVQCPDGYISYVPESSIKFLSESDLENWKNENRYIVTVYDSRLVTEPEGDETVSDLVLGCILKAEELKGDWIKLSTPDGRSGWIKQSEVEYLDLWAKQNINLEKIEKTAKRMMGSGYLWGGTTTKVTDCSGLVKVSYFSNGIILMRDASQQALTGLKIGDWHDAHLGDLLFFGNSTTGRVTHVGIYLQDGKYIHCSGRVKVNNLEPSSPDYLYSPLSISRIDGQIGTKGITYVRDHKWYFK